MFLNQKRKSIISILLSTLIMINVFCHESFAAQSIHQKQKIHHYKKKIYHKKSAKKKSLSTYQANLNFDQLYLRFLRQWQIPGSSVAIIKKNKFIISRGYGWADTAHRTSVTPDSVFRIASVSKTITAIAILKLIQSGRLSLDSKVFTILNDLQPLTDGTRSSRIKNITVRNLLEMSSGWITDQGIDPMLGDWTSAMLTQLHHQIPPDCRTAARMMMTIPMQYAPGTQYSYSNINYCMLGLIINKISGYSGAAGYERFVQQQILSPYGITSMKIGSNALGKQVANEVHYYLLDHSYNLGRIQDGLPYGSTNLLQKNYSDGGWLAKAPDLARFIYALGQNKILTPKMMATLKIRPIFQKNKYDYFSKGVRIQRLNGQVFMVKTGSFTGTQAIVMLGPDGTAYAALFNAKPSNRKVFINQLQQLLINYSKKY